MKVEVSTGIEELKRQFAASACTVRETVKAARTW